MLTDYQKLKTELEQVCDKYLETMDEVSDDYNSIANNLMTEVARELVNSHTKIKLLRRDGKMSYKPTIVVGQF